jgi:hypothetical protein
VIRPATVVILLALCVLAVGLTVTYMMKLRTRADDVRCQHNLRELAWFTADPADPEAKRLPARAAQVPAGTVVLPGVPPADRLSWVPAVLNGVDQKRQNMEPVLAAIDPAQPWAAEKNQQAARAKLFVLLCPGKPPAVVPDQPAPTSYVGVAGLGADAATLGLPALPGEAVSPRAGAFRYDAPTPFELFADGRSQTLVLGERAELGPWLRGGPSTVRGLDDGPGAPPVLGPGGQFGGNHVNGSYWAFADWSVRFFTDRTDPKVLYGLATIAGGEKDPVPGE